MDLTPASLTARGRRVRRLLLSRRRALAAALAALAAVGVARSAEPVPSPTAPLVVAAADLAGGRALAPTDLRVVRRPVDDVPDGAMASLGEVGARVLAAPLRRGEPLTDVRLVAGGLLAGYPGRVAAPVRVADEASVGLLGVGDRVDLVAADPDGTRARVVVADAPVVALPVGGSAADAIDEGSFGLDAGAGGLGAGRGGLVVVAVGDDDALALARASVGAVVSVVLTG